jgi:hypothetical protein
MTADEHDDISCSGPRENLKILRERKDVDISESSRILTRCDARKVGCPVFAIDAAIRLNGPRGPGRVFHASR